MLNKLYTLLMVALVATTCGFTMAKTVEIIRTEPAPVLTTVYDDNHSAAEEQAKRAEKNVMRALDELQEANKRACDLAVAAAAKSQQDAIAQAKAAHASKVKYHGAQQAASALIDARNGRMIAPAA